LGDRSNSMLINELSTIGEDNTLPLCDILKINEEDIILALADEVLEQGLIDENEIEDKTNNPKELDKIKTLRKGELYRLAIAKTILAGLQWRASKIINRHPTYKEILIMTADKMGISNKGSVNQLEAKISQKAFNQFIERLSEKEKEELERELIKTIDVLKIEGLSREDKILAAGEILPSLAKVRLSSFSIYLASTTALSAISSGIGLTLPFVIYASLSRAIGVAIGPVGWILGGVFVLWSSWQPNYKVLIPAILYIAALKSEKEIFDKNKPKKRKKI